MEKEIDRISIFTYWHVVVFIYCSSLLVCISLSHMHKVFISDLFWGTEYVSEAATTSMLHSSQTAQHLQVQLYHICCSIFVNVVSIGLSIFVVWISSLSTLQLSDITKTERFWHIQLINNSSIIS